MFDTIWWKYLHVYMPRQHTLLCAIPTAVCQWTVNVVNCQNVRRRRCKQTLFTLLLVSNATPIEKIAIQFTYKNTTNATTSYTTCQDRIARSTDKNYFGNLFSIGWFFHRASFGISNWFQISDCNHQASPQFTCFRDALEREGLTKTLRFQVISACA